LRDSRGAGPRALQEALLVESDALAPRPKEL